MPQAIPDYDTLTDEQLQNMLTAKRKPSRKQMIQTLRSKRRLSSMPMSDLATERESLRLFLRDLGGDPENAEGWLVALYDQWAAILDEEISRRIRYGRQPRFDTNYSTKPDVVDYIRQNVNIVALMTSQGVELERRGEEWAGLCPFHDDHNPSLSVNMQKRVYHCHACGAGGDCFTFVMEHQHCDFMEAVKRLAHFAGAST